MWHSHCNPRIRWFPDKLRFLRDKITPSEVNNLVEEEVLQCDKSAYIGAKREIDSYYEYLNRHYPTKN